MVICNIQRCCYLTQTEYWKEKWGQTLVSTLQQLHFFIFCFHFWISVEYCKTFISNVPVQSRTTKIYHLEKKGWADIFVCVVIFNHISKFMSKNRRCSWSKESWRHFSIVWHSAVKLLQPPGPDLRDADILLILFKNLNQAAKCVTSFSYSGAAPTAVFNPRVWSSCRVCTVMCSPNTSVSVTFIYVLTWICLASGAESHRKLIYTIWMRC